MTPDDRSGGGTAPGSQPESLESWKARAEAMAWFDRVEALVPRPWLGQAAAIVNALVFVAMTTAAVNLHRFHFDEWYRRALHPFDFTLIGWGANVTSLTLGGEPWRLVTAAFLHAGIVHLLVNAWGLWQMGWVERTLGRSGFVVVYLVSAVAGNLSSLLRSDPVETVGASGALCGLIGSILGTVLVPSRSGVPRMLSGRLLRSLLTVIVLNAFLGATVPMIDNRAHAGGFVAGLLVSLAIMRPPTPAGAAGRARRALLAAIVCSLVLGAGYLALKSRPHPANPTRSASLGGARDGAPAAPR